MKRFGHRMLDHFVAYDPALFYRPQGQTSKNLRFHPSHAYYPVQKTNQTLFILHNMPVWQSSTC